MADKKFFRAFVVGVISEVLRQKGINLGGSGRQEVMAWDALPDEGKRNVLAIVNERLKMKNGVEIVHALAQADSIDADGSSVPSNRRRHRRQAVVKFLADHFDEIADIAMRAIGR